MPEEYDRLAWGLVKEEIRHHTKAVGKCDFETAFSQILVPNKTSYFKSGSLKERELPRIRSKLLQQFTDQLKAFYGRSYKARMGAGNDHAVTRVDSMLFWSQTNVMLLEEEPREETFIELRSLQMAMTRKRLIADLASSFILFNEHALYRMIMRRAVEREPLKALTSDIDEWLPYAVISMVCARFASSEMGEGVFIPYKGGALLGKYRRSQVANDVKTLFERGSEPQPSPRGIRFVDSVKGRRLGDIPYPSLLIGRDQNNQQIAISLHINTWIPEVYFQSEQWWAKFQFEALRAKYSEEFMLNANMIHSPVKEPELDNADDLILRNEDFAHDMSKVLSDRRWAIACRWNRSQNNA